MFGTKKNLQKKKKISKSDNGENLASSDSVVQVKDRGGSRTAATSKMERFVIIVNGWKPLAIITKRSILDVAAALDPPLKESVNISNTLDIESISKSDNLTRSSITIAS